MQVAIFLWNDQVQPLPHGMAGGMAKQLLRALTPELDGAGRVGNDDSVIVHPSLPRRQA
jgi:hypothetical protein